MWPKKEEWRRKKKKKLKNNYYRAATMRAFGRRGTGVSTAFIKKQKARTA